MLPILWRYLLRGYGNVFALSTCAFVAILIVSRFKEIARFAALCNDWGSTMLFLFYQIPFILPLAIPVSALLSAFLLMQRISASSELSAMRTFGLSLKKILTPILIGASFLTLVNFSFCACISPFCKRESKTLLYQSTSNNPLLLLQRQNLVKIKGSYLKMSVRKDGNLTKNLILITPNKKNQRLALFAARSLRILKTKLLGNDAAVITYLNSNELHEKDPIILENQKLMSTDASFLSSALKKYRPKLNQNMLTLRMLRLHLQGTDKQAKVARIEILRCITLTLAVLTFTLLGCAFGMQSARTPSKTGACIALFLALCILLSYLCLKELKSHINLALFITFAPHAIIWALSLAKFMKLDFFPKNLFSKTRT